MKKAVVIISGFILVVWIYSFQMPEKKIKVEANQGVWDAIIKEMLYTRDRALESNLTDVQKTHIDSSMTQILRIFITQYNQQTADTATHKKP